MEDFETLNILRVSEIAEILIRNLNAVGRFRDSEISRFPRARKLGESKVAEASETFGFPGSLENSNLPNISERLIGPEAFEILEIPKTFRSLPSQDPRCFRILKRLVNSPRCRNFTKRFAFTTIL